MRHLQRVGADVEALHAERDAHPAGVAEGVCSRGQCDDQEEKGKTSTVAATQEYRGRQVLQGSSTKADCCCKVVQ